MSGLKEGASAPVCGCRLTPDGAEFTLWAPKPAAVEWTDGSGRRMPMLRGEDGHWTLLVPGFGAGERYGYLPDGQGPFPDPASRFQPDGVHGLSQAVDLSGYAWRHAAPPLPDPARRSVYELHVGTFTPVGTFAAAAARLPELRDLGINLVELMPVGDFPGNRNWGYDGVSLYAPARCYGSPEDLCALVDAAHGLGLCVLLDVVYNHFGPDGNYTDVYSADYEDRSQHTPWGAAMNFGGEHAAPVRAFFRENAVAWISDYRFDGLRLDATHAIRDASSRNILEEIAAAARAAAREQDGRNILVYAEDHRNPGNFLRPVSEGGLGLDGVWADDWHHHIRRKTAGDDEGYFADFDGSLENIALTLRQGWFRDGTEKTGPRSHGDSPEPFDYAKFLICLQNHDQVGNRALGERLHHQVSAATYRAVSALLLLAPETPLLFMGQEWACKSPFQFFTDHEPGLGALVTAGRRKEFAGFRAFNDPALRETIPDPQAESTFARSRLEWGERAHPPHAACLEWYRALLRLRNTHPALGSASKRDGAVIVSGQGLVLLRRHAGRSLMAGVCLEPTGGKVFLPEIPGKREWDPLEDSEAEAYASYAPGGPSPIAFETWSEGLELRFARPGAWVGEA